VFEDQGQETFIRTRVHVELDGESGKGATTLGLRFGLHRTSARRGRMDWRR